MIAAGSRIRVKDDPSKIGSVTGATRQLNGRLYLGVEFDTGKSDFLLASRLEALSDLPDALRDLARGLLSAPADLGRMLTHLRLTGRLADIIYSMEATNTVFHAYQFKPVIKILNSAARGLLVADEVGLGKTIEAGLVWTELVARYNAHRLLVVCPKSLQEKWRLELRNRFGVLAQIVDADGLLETLKETRSTGGDFALIASLTAVRAPKGWEEADAPAQGGREALARYLDDNADADPLLDLVIFDEAHHLRNPETAQHKSARQLVAIADYKLMLSATPINLRSEDLRSLLRLLEPDIFDREWIFDELQQENAPIVAARERALTKACSLADLREAVADISVGRLLKTDRRLKILRDQLNSDVITDTPARRADIAARLEEMSLLGGLLNRTRRRDVAEIQIKRRAACRTWSMTYGERSFYDRASATIREYAYRNDINDGFLLSNTQRVLASSLAAAFLRWSRLETDLGTDEDGGDEEVDGVGPLVAALNRCCRDRSDYEALKAGDSKYTLFRTALDDTWKAAPEEKVIVFSSFRGTIDYLAERLKADGVPFEKLHGSIKDGRMDVLARFSKARGRCVLLSSEIGSEGLDLQFCRLLINYDLPWNPMRVEQRIGRIDRIGQVAPSVEIFSLICEATIEEKIYHRLYERLNLIERSLGGFEPILGDIIAELQDRLLDPSLSPEDVDREIERAVLSAETRKKHEEALEAEAPGLIAHGDMILQRIKRTHEQQGWIGAEELYEYARLGLQAAYPHSTLDRAPIEPVAYDLRLCAAGHDAFRKFLETSSRRYPTRLRRNALARVVFGKNTDALPEADVEVLHAGHPFIRFLGRVQDRGALAGAARPAVWGEADPRSLPPDLEAGRFGIVIQRWSTNGVSAQDKLVYAGLNLDSGTLLKPHQAEAVALQSVRNLRQAAPSADELARTVAMLETQLVGEHLRADSEAFFAAEEASHADKKETLVAVLRRQLESHREKAEARIAEYQAVGGAKARMIPAERGKIGKYVARMEAKIVEIESGRNFEFEEPVTVGVLVVEAGECRSLGSD